MPVSTARLHPPPQGTTIVRLRVAASGQEPLVVRLRAAATLEGMSLEPSRLPPAAILCVRAVRDPLPGTLDLGTLQPFVGHAAAAGWQRAVTAHLDRVASLAARPVREAVPLGAEAVLFADRAELLACLARDWLAGRVHAHWWWQHLVRQLAVDQALLRTWSAAPECVPAALALLTALGESVAFVARLPAAHIGSLLERVIERFGLGRLRTAIGTASQPTPIGAASSVAPTTPGVVPIRLPDAWSAPRVQPPWSNVVPLAAGGLPATSQLLLGTSLCLVQRPAQVRTPDFAQRTGAWLRTFASPRATGSGASNGSAGPTGALARGVSRAEPTPLELPGEPDALVVPGEPRTGEVSLGERATGSNDGPPEGENVVSPPTAPPTPAAESDPAGGDPPRQAAAAVAEPDAAPTRDPPTEVETHFGGLFFLINLALQRELYADFSAPFTPGLELPIWDFLALMAERLGPLAVRDDPVWSLLATLSGRVDELPADAWIDELAADLQQRLVRALGLQDACEVGPVMLRHAARILLAAGRLDVVFRMDDVFGREPSAFPVRLAGLDRDPGWVPAAGRAIAFHFV